MRPLNKILLINLVASAGIAIFSFTLLHALPKGDSSFPLWILISGVALIILQSSICCIVAIVYFVKKKTHHGLGFLLSGLLVFIIGFGTCSAMMLTLNSG
jgi:hypothetical protein